MSKNDYNEQGTPGIDEATILEHTIIFDEDGRPKGINYDIAANLIVENYDVIHVIETGNTYIYDKGIYIEHGEEILKMILYHYYKDYPSASGKSLIKKADISEIIARVQSKRLNSIKIFENKDPLFNVANGTLNLETLELLPHSPERVFLTKSPVIYDPNAKCPQFMAYLVQALDTKYHPLIGEVIGYILWPTYHIHKAFMFLGPKRTGKGTMLRVIQSVVGESDCSHVSLQDLAGQRFSRARLFGKKVNIYGDLPATPIADAGIFKNLTGQDKIDAENKFERIFSYQNQAKLLFSANTLPTLKTEDDAFYGR